MGDRCHEACDVLPAAGAALWAHAAAWRRIEAFLPPRSQHLLALCNFFPTELKGGRLDFLSPACFRLVPDPGKAWSMSLVKGDEGQGDRTEGAGAPTGAHGGGARPGDWRGRRKQTQGLFVFRDFFSLCYIKKILF